MTFCGLAALALLAACSPRPDIASLDPLVGPPDPAARVLRIYAVTNRSGQSDFGSVPAQDLSYLWYDLSIPQEHGATGLRQMSEAVPVLDHGTLSRRAFLQQVSRAAGPQDLGIFVHGYNMRFPEAVFQLAQMAAAGAAVPVLYSWPSQGNPLTYEADRQVVLLSRDRLAGLIADMSGQVDGQQRKLVVLGHSMGGFLTAEALRSLALQGRRDVLRRSEVILAAPDIDLGVFASQLEAIGPMDPPVTVLVAPDDRVLALSARVANNTERLGALAADSAEVSALVADHAVTVVDVSRVAGDLLRHKRFLQLAQLYTRNAPAPLRRLQPGGYVLEEERVRPAAEPRRQRAAGS